MIPETQEYGRGTRQRTFTDKGLDYEVELRQKRLTSAIRKWRNKTNDV